jgi:hypothetical protein
MKPELKDKLFFIKYGFSKDYFRAGIALAFCAGLIFLIVFMGYNAI